jgi:hypothetical protein
MHYFQDDQVYNGLELHYGWLKESIIGRTGLDGC